MENDKKESDKKRQERQHYVNEIEELTGKFNEISLFDEMYCVKDDEKSTVKEKNNNSPFYIELNVENEMLKCEIGTGSAISAISEQTYCMSKKTSRLEIRKTKREFKTYHGKCITPVGVLEVTVKNKGKSYALELFVLPGTCKIPIIGRPWLRALKLVSLNESGEGLAVHTIQKSQWKSDIEKEFQTVFSGKVGKYRGGKFALKLKPNVTPVFCKPRPVPYAMRVRLEIELERLMKEGIIEQVTSSDCATPIVPIPKSNGNLRVCGNYKITLNPNLVIDRHPIQRVSDLPAKLEKGKFFTTLDLEQAYQQIELVDSSKDLTTISTHKGVFRFNRLSYGIATAPSLFQREMEKS